VNVEELRQISLFAGISDAGLERLARCAAEVEAKPGQMLARYEDPGSGMFVIREGTATVELRAGSVEIGPGDFFGELALLAPDTGRVARVRAKSALRCVSLPREDVMALIESEPALALRMLRELARRLAEARRA
jgi:CRP-like cAMP-binding protein